ncbi:hypothetical protein [Vitiosangium sp. GDMCC 1.1324]|uniref:hypothetical protein n=1 Tax=Vitiosangium sp. (strain GDMCC 1.1324) TaxID=2138576 RepID=UPI000D390311|nr:hypothetical protein [Vitiosangium sp. GDMCC 1.1324]PTL82214.1 hypothetical protein DAT35_20715 [Vitiosangium sp. GDMCC 1.1324]
MTNPEWLKTAVRRSAHEAWMLGHVFEKYREREGRSAEELAAELGCSLEVLQWLSLCRRPEGEKFTEHVFTIAKRFALEPLRLVAVLRRVEVMDAFAERSEGGEGPADEDSLLLAARDRSCDDETNS